MQKFETVAGFDVDYFLGTVKIKKVWEPKKIPEPGAINYCRTYWVIELSIFQQQI